MNVLSLFDGMACGMLAFQKAGIPVDTYTAYEIDKYAIKTATHNFPNIKECGDVFEADFTQYKDVDWIVGGSPCTYWSIAQKNNRETEASGMGWELFSQYVRAVKETKPKFFLYENNKSMSTAIRQSISEAFGFEPICINSALVSAQNRQRLYWVGKRNDDGTYSKVDVQQPEDRGILLKDILDTGVSLREKSLCLDANYYKGGNLSNLKKQSGQRLMVAEPVSVRCRGREGMGGKWEARTDGKNGVVTANTVGINIAEPVNTTSDGKAQCLRATYYKDGIRNMVGNNVDKKTCVAEPIKVGEINGGGQGNRIYSVDGKSVSQTATSGGMGSNTGLYAIPLETDNKSTSEPVRVGASPRPNGELSISYEFMDCKIRDNAHIAINENAIRGVQNKNNASCAENFYELTNRKANTLTTAHVPKIIDKFENYTGYAVPCEWDENGNPTKAISCADGKTYTVYEVKDGQITIKGKQYPIKLVDGYYIIRKLTVSECKRLQTVPEWYEFPVSNTQAYKMLGNSWTVDVIVHLIESALKKERD